MKISNLLAENEARKVLLQCQQALVELGFDVDIAASGNLVVSTTYEGKKYVNHVDRPDNPRTVVEDAAIWLIGAIDYYVVHGLDGFAPDDWLDEDRAVKIVSYMLDPSKQVMFKQVKPKLVKHYKDTFRAEGWELLGDSIDVFNPDVGCVELIFGKRK